MAHSCVFDVHSIENLDFYIWCLLLEPISHNIVALDFDFQI